MRYGRAREMVVVRAKWDAFGCWQLASVTEILELEPSAKFKLIFCGACRSSEQVLPPCSSPSEMCKFKHAGESVSRQYVIYLYQIITMTICTQPLRGYFKKQQ